jgi:hypothetical protein
MIRSFLAAAPALLAVVLAACGPARLAGPAGEPVPDPTGFAADLRRGSTPDGPRQITFAWTLDERGSRVRGRGVVRTEPPERIRLDLFGPRGETYLVAALIGQEYRLPSEAAAAAPLPSPSLLWAALGVLGPPPDATLASATLAQQLAELRYENAAGEVFAFTFERAGENAFLLARLERASGRGVLETVTVDRSSNGEISRARYRDWSEYRDLTLDVEATRSTGPFPPDVWRPDAVSP